MLPQQQIDVVIQRLQEAPRNSHDSPRHYRLLLIFDFVNLAQSSLLDDFEVWLSNDLSQLAFIFAAHPIRLEVEYRFILGDPRNRQGLIVLDFPFELLQWIKSDQIVEILDWSRIYRFQHLRDLKLVLERNLDSVQHRLRIPHQIEGDIVDMVRKVCLPFTSDLPRLFVFLLHELNHVGLVLDPCFHQLLTYSLQPLSSSVPQNLLIADLPKEKDESLLQLKLGIVVYLPFRLRCQEVPGRKHDHIFVNVECKPDAVLLPHLLDLVLDHFLPLLLHLLHELGLGRLVSRAHEEPNLFLQVHLLQPLVFFQEGHLLEGKAHLLQLFQALEEEVGRLGLLICLLEALLRNFVQLGLLLRRPGVLLRKENAASSPQDLI